MHPKQDADPSSDPEMHTLFAADLLLTHPIKTRMPQNQIPLTTPMLLFKRLQDAGVYLLLNTWEICFLIS